MRSFPDGQVSCKSRRVMSFSGAALEGQGSDGSCCIIYYLDNSSMTLVATISQSQDKPTQGSLAWEPQDLRHRDGYNDVPPDGVVNLLAGIGDFYVVTSPL